MNQYSTVIGKLLVSRKQTMASSVLQRSVYQAPSFDKSMTYLSNLNNTAKKDLQNIEVSHIDVVVKTPEEEENSLFLEMRKFYKEEELGKEVKKEEIDLWGLGENFNLKIVELRKIKEWEDSRGEEFNQSGSSGLDPFIKLIHLQYYKDELKLTFTTIEQNEY